MTEKPDYLEHARQLYDDAQRGLDAYYDEAVKASRDVSPLQRIELQIQLAGLALYLNAAEDDLKRTKLLTQLTDVQAESAVNLGVARPRTREREDPQAALDPQQEPEPAGGG